MCGATQSLLCARLLLPTTDTVPFAASNHTSNVAPQRQAHCHTNVSADLSPVAPSNALPLPGALCHADVSANAEPHLDAHGSAVGQDPRREGKGNFGGERLGQRGRG